MRWGTPDAVLASGPYPDHVARPQVAVANKRKAGVVLSLYRRHAVVDVFRRASGDCRNHGHDVLVVTVCSGAVVQNPDGPKTVHDTGLLICMRSGRPVPTAR